MAANTIHSICPGKRRCSISAQEGAAAPQETPGLFLTQAQTESTASAPSVASHVRLMRGAAGVALHNRDCQMTPKAQAIHNGTRGWVLGLRV